MNDLWESINIPEFAQLNDECLLDVSMEGGLADLTDEDISKPKFLEDELKLLDEPSYDGVASKMAKIGLPNENFQITSLIA